MATVFHQHRISWKEYVSMERVCQGYVRHLCIYAVGVACGEAVNPGLGLLILCGVATVGRVLKGALFSIFIEKLWLESVDWASATLSFLTVSIPWGKVLLVNSPQQGWVGTLNHGHSLPRSRYVHSLSDRMHSVRIYSVHLLRV